MPRNYGILYLLYPLPAAAAGQNRRNPMILNRKILTTLLSIVLGVLLVSSLLKWSGNYRAQLQEQLAASAGEGTDTAVPVIRYNRLSYFNGSATLEFMLNENGSWVWTADQSFPLDDTTIQTILTLLDELQPLRAGDVPEELEEYQLGASPVATLTASGESESRSIRFGRETEAGGTSRYALLSEDDASLYILPADLLEPMSVAIYDMMELPKLPTVDATRIDFVRLFGKPLAEGGYETYTILTAQRPELSEGQTLTPSDVVWRSNGADVTANATVQNLISAITALSIDKCVDYRPSPDAVTHCGFDAPAAVLEVDFLTEGGAEQTLKLTVGNLLPDGTGRYVRYGDEDPSLYRLPNDLLEALLAIAAAGLEY